MARPATTSDAGNDAGHCSANPVARVVFSRRADLVISRQDYDGTSCFVVKDPISLAYYRFRGPEMRILELLDGQRSLLVIQETLVADGIDRDSVPDVASIEQFVLRLAADGLLVSGATGRGDALLAKRRRRQAGRPGNLIGNLLYLKFPGADPTEILDRLYPIVRPLFTPLAMLLAMILVTIGTTVAVIESEHIKSGIEQQTFDAFFTPTNIIVLWLVLGSTKIVHEFGHALTCRHFGGECHDMGFLLLVLSPALYCNTSDAWTLPNKWHRIAISGAGIVVELVIASVATLIWWWTAPGLLHNVAFSTMFICSVSTLLINGNPLMRYDGYYILCDLLEIPNLRGRSVYTLRQLFARLAFGPNLSAVDTLPQKNRFLFCFYAISATVYRWFVCGLILWFLYNVLRPYGLSTLSLLLAAAASIGLIFQPLAGIVRMASMQFRSVHGWRRLRVATGAAVLALVPALLLFAPIPVRVKGSLTLGGRDQVPVFAEVPGRLVEVAVQPGQQVEPGQLIARFENPGLEGRVLRLEAEVRKLRTQVEKHWALNNPAEVQAIRELLAAREQQLIDRRAQLDRLDIHAATAGRVMAAPRVAHWFSDAVPSSPLNRWEGHVLQQRNVGCYLHAGTMLCEISPLEICEAELLVDQNRFDYVKTGQPVRVCLDAWPDHKLNGVIHSVALREADDVPSQLSATRGGDLVTSQDPYGQQLLLRTYYQIGVTLEPDAADCGSTWQHGIGMRGRARIDCGRRPAYQFLTRAVSELSFL